MRRFGYVLVCIIIFMTNFSLVAKAENSEAVKDYETEQLIFHKNMTVVEKDQEDIHAMREVSPNCKHTSPIGTDALHSSMRFVRKVHHQDYDTMWYECVFCGYQMAVDLPYCDCFD